MATECLQTESKIDYLVTNIFEVSAKRPDPETKLHSFFISAESWFDAKRLCEQLRKKYQLGDKPEFEIKSHQTICLVACPEDV